MTATLVNGIAVEASHPALSPLSKGDKVVRFKRIAKLFLADGTTLYGCTECDFTHISMPMVRGHLGSVHMTPERRAANRQARGRSTPVVSGAAGVVVKLIAENEKLTADLAVAKERADARVATWRERARTAEKELAAIHAAFSKATGI